MTRIAGIDVGSNALRIAIGEAGTSGKVKVLHTSREAVRLGGEVFDKGTVSTNLISRATGAFWNFRELCDEHGVVLIRAVGTSALRDATNADEFVQEIATQTGIKVDVISGDRESHLVQLAVSNKVDLRRKLSMLIDIGGGSTEVSLLLNGKSIYSQSHNVGTVRLLKLISKRRNPYRLLSRIVGSYVNGMKKSLKRKMAGRKITLCIGTGGNFEALAALRTSMLGKNGGKKLSLRDLDKLIARLTSLSVRERVSELKLRPDRADVIVPAAITISQIMRSAGVHEINVPGVGLREGVLLDTASHISRRRREVVHDEACKCAQSIGLKFSFEKLHAERVRHYALLLFDKTRRLHGLDVEDRLLLEVASILHDVGMYIGEPEHHHHSSYIIRTASWAGLEKRQINMVACIARYHRRSSPKPDHDIYKDLAQADRERVKKMSALIRIADALDRGRGSSIRRLGITTVRGKIIMKLPHRQDSELIKWAIEKKSDLFRDVFHKEVVVRSPK